MTPEQFVYWLKGFLHSKSSLKDEDLSDILDGLDQVKTTPSYQWPVITASNAGGV